MANHAVFIALSQTTPFDIQKKNFSQYANSSDVENQMKKKNILSSQDFCAF